ncbi:MAG: transketolase family protein [Oscillospiraceae bacterium]|nr:transketolase family protein [Oscillospiraceae bacterium]
MAEIKKIATRDSYGATLRELGAEHEDIIVLDADLSGSTRTGVFAKAFPDRFINCGIAEADMICVSGGLSTMGFVPFCSSFAMFLTGRAYEQIRNTIGYPELNVKLCASHAGLSVGEDGASHQCCEDFALMRNIPGMVVMSPADDVEARAAVRAAYAHKGPVYIRLGRAAVPVVFDENNFEFSIGKAQVLRPGKDVAILATGLMVERALQAAEQLSLEGIDARVIDVCTIKPLDEEVILSAAAECGGLITCEEHSIVGGLGEAVASLTAEKLPTRVRRIGVEDVYGVSGPWKDVLDLFGLNAAHITAVAHELTGK